MWCTEPKVRDEKRGVRFGIDGKRKQKKEDQATCQTGDIVKVLGRGKGVYK